VGQLQQSELGAAGRIFRDAFGAFLGVGDLFGDTDCAVSRWHATPDAALGARLDGQLAGSYSRRSL
jgi:hypothetical protein